jgi:hypothetical protein
VSLGQVEPEEASPKSTWSVVPQVGDGDKAVWQKGAGEKGIQEDGQAGDQARRGGRAEGRPDVSRDQAGAIPL